MTQVTSIIRPSLSALAGCNRWLVDRKELAELLGVAHKTIQNLHNSGRISRAIRFIYGPPRCCVPGFRDWMRMECPGIDERIELQVISGSLPTYKWGIAPRPFEGEAPHSAGICIEPHA